MNCLISFIFFWIFLKIFSDPIFNFFSRTMANNLTQRSNLSICFYEDVEPGMGMGWNFSALALLAPTPSTRARSDPSIFMKFWVKAWIVCGNASFLIRLSDNPMRKDIRQPWIFTIHFLHLQSRLIGIFLKKRSDSQYQKWTKFDLWLQLWSFFFLQNIDYHFFWFFLSVLSWFKLFFYYCPNKKLF